MTEEKKVNNLKGVIFYASILKSKNPRNAFYPIVRLIGHRSAASVDIRNVAKNVDELTDFFKFNKDTFIVKDCTVKLVDSSVQESANSQSSSSKETCPTNTNNSTLLNIKNNVNKSTSPKQSNQDVNFLNAVEFYFSKILLKKCEVSLIQLAGYRGGASSEIKSVAKNHKQLKTFLSKYPKVFNIKGNSVNLSPFIIDLFNSITSFLSTLIDYYQKEEVTVEKLFINCKSNFKSVKLDSVSQLKECLLKYDSIFEVNGNVVSIRPLFLSQVKNKVSAHSEAQTWASLSRLISKVIFEKEIDYIKNSTAQSNQPLVQNDNIHLKTDDRYLLSLKPSVNSPDVSPQQFFLEKLWNCGFCKVISIDELFKLKSQAPSHVQSKCGNNIAEFRKFLSQYPESFIVTGDNVLARGNIPRKKWCPASRGIEEPISSMIVNFFKNYTKHGKPEQIERLFQAVGKYFAKSDDLPVFESAKTLESFLSMFPHIFYISDSKVVNITCHCKEIIKDQKPPAKSKSKKSAPDPGPNIIYEGLNGVDWKLDVLKRTELVTSVGRCKEVYNNLLKDSKVIALDCEGFNLGVGGELSLIQIGIEDGKVFIFDIHTCPDLVISGKLKNIFESTDILKVIHDSRNDIANLHFQFGVSVNHIFDTRIAHGFITNPYQPLARFPSIGFNSLCNIYGAPINMEKDALKDVYKQNARFWLRRPLEDDMLAYAALDVACLVPYVYNTMKKKLDDLIDEVLILSEQHSKSRI